MDRKLKRNIYLILGISAIVYLGNFFYRTTIEMTNNPIELVTQIPTDYLDLFNPAVQNELRLTSGASLKLRNKIVVLQYQNKYAIHLSKFNVSSHFDTKSDIIESYSEPDGNFPQMTVPYKAEDINIIFKGSSETDISKLYVTINGDSTHAYKRDNDVLYYFSYLKDASVQFQPKGVYEIFMDDTSSRFAQAMPVIIMFIKRNNSLYFISLQPIEKKLEIQPDLLNRMLAL